MAILAQLQRLLLPSATQNQAHLLYVAVVDQARQTFFYENMQVPDSLDGRFEMLVLHLVLIMEYMSGSEQKALMEAHIADMDRNLREIGVGDMGVGRKVQAMASGFYGREKAYKDAGDDRQKWTEALRRNVYGTVMDVAPESIEQLLEYIFTCKQRLAEKAGAITPQDVQALN